MADRTKQDHCSLCKRVGDVGDEPMTHLDLYALGSEGITVCLGCRMTLTDTARGMMRASATAYRTGYEKARSIMGPEASKQGDE